MQQRYPHIFSPITIGNVVFKNRIWSAPAGAHLLYGREEYPSQAAFAYYSAKAAGGAAVITYSAQNMDFHQPYDAVHACENILHPESHRFFSQFTDMIHFHDAKASLELLAFQYHGYDHNQTLVPYSINGDPGPDGSPTVKLTRAAMESIAKSYGAVAEAALECGFDMLLIHAGHGLCLSQFFSPVMNRRDDDFSYKPLENRMRFADLILDAIRAKVGRRLLIEFRISGDELSGDKGYHVEDCIEMLKHIQDRIDIAHVSTGTFYNGTENITHPTEFLAHGCNAQYAAAVKACPDIKIPVLTLGAFQKPELIEETLASGKADMVAMARGLIADAQRVNKFQRGKEDEAIPCIRCFHCLNYNVAPTFACSVNPTVGRESVLPLLIPPVGPPKKAVIVGGGPAGMAAAITAAQRGHSVILLEQDDHLGGKLVFSRQVPFKHDLCRFMDYQIHMLDKLGVDVRLNTTATPELLASLKPDAVISAVGADPAVPPIPGIHNANVITAESAYHKASAGEALGNRIVVLGGGLVGCETGLYLAMEAGKKVTIIEMLPEVARDEMYLTRDALLDRLEEYTTLITGARCTGIDETGLTYVDEHGKTHSLDCDTVVLSAGMRPRQEQAEAFRGIAPFFVRIGDCVKATNVRNATRTGFDAAVRL
ncbi:MAG: FAD-dependent oxidoreductase [Oscillospiraceae bacterium]|nr:FAD-dependent oxidoreductase [Oscillospiraceae bacterium]